MAREKWAPPAAPAAPREEPLLPLGERVKAYPGQAELLGEGQLWRLKDGRVVLLGYTPPAEHDCDQMGCGSLDRHVLWRGREET